MSTGTRSSEDQAVVHILQCDAPHQNTPIQVSANQEPHNSGKHWQTGVGSVVVCASEPDPSVVISPLPV